MQGVLLSIFIARNYLCPETGTTDGAWPEDVECMGEGGWKFSKGFNSPINSHPVVDTGVYIFHVR